MSTKRDEKTRKSAGQSKTQVPAQIPEPLPAPGKSETKAIEEATARVKAKPQPFRVKFDKTETGGTNVGAPHADTLGFSSRIQDAFGTGSPDFATMELRRLLKALGSSNTKMADEATINAALAVVDGIKPENEVEAMLACQMALTHVLAMQAMSRAHWADMIPEYQAAGNFAIKLSRTFTMQIEALAKLRRKGEQTVRVEHVHVHSGGQAIVGNVSNHGGGGGAHGNADQPHAPGENAQFLRSLTAEPVAPLWSENQEREPVPVTSGERA
jgi:hypothetical protein